MLISCLMPTYNRFPMLGHLVEEAVYSFLRQFEAPGLEYELIICNDTPGQRIYFSSGRIKVWNMDERFPTLSDKIQFMIGAAEGELLCRWDDDDISLPTRLRYSYEKLGDRLEWRPGNYFYAERHLPLREVKHPGNTHIMSLWRRDVLKLMGGVYPPKLSGIEDQAFNAALFNAGVSPHQGEVIPREEIYYLYRWGTGSRHLSGKASEVKGNPHQAHYDEIGAAKIEQGRFQIYPHWKRDYPELAEETLAARS